MRFVRRTDVPEIVLYDDARHGFFNYGKSDYHEEVTRKTAAFIFSVLGE